MSGDVPHVAGCGSSAELREIPKWPHGDQLRTFRCAYAPLPPRSVRSGSPCCACGSAGGAGLRVPFARPTPAVATMSGCRGLERLEAIMGSRLLGKPIHVLLPLLLSAALLTPAVSSTTSRCALGNRHHPSLIEAASESGMRALVRSCETYRYRPSVSTSLKPSRSGGTLGPGRERHRSAPLREGPGTARRGSGTRPTGTARRSPARPA